MTQEASSAQEPASNVVTLVGRVTSAPVERTLPSGDVMVSFRLSLRRQRTPMARGSKQATDWVDCVAVGGRCRRSVGSWNVGDKVRVEGALRRRFYRGPGGPSTRLEVEALSARRLSHG
jgi:single-strand DNA-binding protein